MADHMTPGELWWDLRKTTVTQLHVEWGAAQYGTLFATHVRMQKGPPVTIALSLKVSLHQRSKSSTPYLEAQDLAEGGNTNPSAGCRSRTSTSSRASRITWSTRRTSPRRGVSWWSCAASTCFRSHRSSGRPATFSCGLSVGARSVAQGRSSSKFRRSSATHSASLGVAGAHSRRSPDAPQPRAAPERTRLRARCGDTEQ